MRKSGLSLLVSLLVVLILGTPSTRLLAAPASASSLSLAALAERGAILPDRVVVQLDEHTTTPALIAASIGKQSTALVRATAADQPVASFFSLPVAADQRDALLAQLRETPGVRYAGPEYVYHATSEPLFTSEWSMHNTGQVIGGVTGTVDADLDGPEAWANSTGSASVVVAVVDSGVDLTHVDLSANIWTNSGQACGVGDGDGNTLIGDCKGYDFVSSFSGSGSNGPRDDDPSPCSTDILVPDTGDCNGVDDNGDGSADNFAVHGTHVAGIIAAPQNSLGISGVAPNVKIMPVRALTEDGTGITTDVLAAMNYAIDEGADVINMSFGSDVFDSSFDSVVLAADAANVVLVAAAGNANENIMTGTDCDSPVCNDDPNSTGLNGVISIAATNNKDRKSGFSNYSTQGYVDLAAPGQSIISTCYQNSGTPSCPTDLGGGGRYATISGTSQATPHVSGVAALIRSISPSISAQDLATVLFATSDNITSANVGLGGCGGSDCTTGSGGQIGRGRVNAANIFDPSIISLSPGRATRGTLGLSVTLTGLNTGFSGSSNASFGTGINVTSTSCSSATRCTAVIDVTDSATLGDHSVTIKTGSQTVSSLAAFVVDDSILRIAGPNRIGTAIEISKNGFPANGSADAVLIARSDTFPDSLAGGPLASLATAPILFTPSDSLDSFTQAEIERVLDPGSDSTPDIYVLGQTAALSSAVEAQLGTLNANWQVKRLGGINRVDTAVAIADEGNALRGGAPSQVVVATQGTFADALSAGVPAGDPVIDGSRMPILLTDRTNLSAGTAAYLSAYRNTIGAIFVVGGTAAVSDAVVTQMSQYVGNIQRLDGADRYETAQAVAEYFYPTPVSISFASGLNFPDAMAGNWHSSSQGSPLLLVRGSETPQATIDYVQAHAGTVLGGFLYGGTAVIPDDVKTLLEGIM
ncbi:MAG: S8 family serine peptidase [Candidatus Andersenbacteria bacterium]